MISNKKCNAIYFCSVILLVLAILLVDRAFAGLPPTTLKGANDATAPVTFNVQAPNSMVARVNSTTGYISQLQKNWLIDPDFMDLTLTKWTTSFTQTKETGTYLNNKVSRKIAISVPTLTYVSVISQSITPNQNYAGINFEGDMRALATNANLQYRLCFAPTASLPATSAFNLQCSVFTSAINTWNTFTTFDFGLISGTSYTLTLDVYNPTGSTQTDSVYASDSYFGAPISLGPITPPNTFTVYVAPTCTTSTCTIASQTPYGITWVSSITRGSTGFYNINVVSGLFTSTPNCTASPGPGSSGIGLQVGTSTSLMNIYAYSNSSTAVDVGFTLTCTKTGSDYTQSAISPSTPAVPNVVHFTASGTYTPTAGTKYIEVKMVGGGGGGGGSGTATGTSATAGTATTFGSLLSAGGGGQGSWGSDGGGVNSNNITLPAIDIDSTIGASGSGSWALTPTGIYASGGDGGQSCFGGGVGGARGITGPSAGANTGSGGTGAGIQNLANSSTGSGGASGGCVHAYVVNPSGSYTITVGAGGNGGGAGTSGSAGGNGGTGYVVIIEYFGTMNAPLLVGSVTSNSSGAEKLERARFGGATDPSSCTSSPCTINSTSSSWLSVTRVTTGQYTLAITGFSGIPSCTCTSINSGGFATTCTTVGASSTAKTLYTTYFSSLAGVTSGADSSVEIICMGPR